MMVLKAILGFLCILISGMFIYVLIDDRKLPLYYVFSISWIIGTAFFSYLLFISSLVFSSFSPLLFLFILFFTFILKLAKNKKYLISKKEIFISLFFLFVFILWEARAISYPLYFYDELLEWGSKGLFIFHSKTPFIPQLTDPGYFHSHKNYPLLTPYLESWIYYTMGEVDMGAVKIIFPAFLFSILGIIYFHLQEYSKNFLISCFSPLLILSIPYFFWESLRGYADIPLASFYTLSLIYLIKFFEERGKKYVVYSIFSLSAMPFCKNEGYFLYLICFLIIILIFIFNIKQKGLEYESFQIFLTLFSLIFISIWIYVLVHFPVNRENYPANLFNLVIYKKNIYRIREIFKNWIPLLLDYKKFGFIFIFYAFTPLLVLLKNVNKTDFLYLIACYLPIIGYFIIFYISPFEISYLTNSALHRLTTHFLPLWIFFFFKNILS